MSEDKKKDEKYIYAVGRRKTAVARVKVYDNVDEKEKGIVINNKDCKDYFSNNSILLEKIYSPLRLLKLENRFKVSVKVVGGGPNGQAEAIRLGIARVLSTMDKSYEEELKVHSYLTRDPREVERKKPGLKKARRAPQWQKR